MHAALISQEQGTEKTAEEGTYIANKQSSTTYIN
jgi:hypothetical protein